MVQAGLEYWILMDKDYHYGNKHTINWKIPTNNGVKHEKHTSFGIEHPMGVSSLLYIDVYKHSLNRESLGTCLSHATNCFAKMLLNDDKNANNSRLYLTISFDKNVEIQGIPKCDGAERTLFKNMAETYIPLALANERYINTVFSQVALMLQYELQTGKEM